MRIEVITQSAIGTTQWLCVGEALNAIIARSDCQRFRFAVAYMRISGIRLLYDSLQALRSRAGRISGAVGIDQGVTTIEALELLGQLSTESTIVCTASNYIYHPKLYLMEGNKWASVVIGSANMTRDGLYRNVELATIIHLELASIPDGEIYRYYDAFLCELLNPINPNVQSLNDTTLKWLSEMAIIEDEGRVPEPQPVTRSNSATAKLRELFPPLPVPSVPAARDVKRVLTTVKETSVLASRAIPAVAHIEQFETSATQSLSSIQPSENKLSVDSSAETPPKPLLARETMHKQHMLDLLQQGKDVWNQWREEHPEIQPDLSESNLQGAILRKVNLRSANLSGANLSGARLGGADLSESNLQDAILRRTSFHRANLSRANLSRADLQNAILGYTDLYETNLNDAILKDTVLYEVNLDNVILDEKKLVILLKRQRRLANYARKMREIEDK